MTFYYFYMFGDFNPAPMELRGSPCLGTQIQPLNPWILNTHKEIFIQNEFILI
jgi:hypothetical protein